MAETFKETDGTWWEAAKFRAVDPVIPDGMIVGAASSMATKIGDGVRRWSSLRWVSVPALGAGPLVRQPSTAPTDGQLLAWSSTLGQYVAVNPSGPAELASAVNGYSGGAALNVQDYGGSVYTSLPGMSITVPPSNGRPVTIEWGGLFQQSASGSGDIWTKVVSGGQDVGLAVRRLPVDTGVAFDPAQMYETVHGQAAIGPVTEPTVYSLQAMIYRVGGANPSGAFLAIGVAPLTLRALAG